MKRLILVMVVLAFAFTASAQYAECQQCRTWQEELWSYTYPPTFLRRAWYANCEIAMPGSLTGYTYCAVDTFANCGQQPPPGRNVDDYHCHLQDVCTTYQDPCCGSPIAIKLSSGAWSLTGTDDPVRIDLTGNGVEAFAWTAGDSDIAFLFYDRNGNGAVNAEIGELFGTWGGRVSGFEPLAEFDENGDGILSAEDEHAWPALQLWVDRNHNGRSEPDEISGIVTSQVEWLDLNYRMTDREDRHGNKFKYVALAGFKDGGRRPYYDLFFRRVTVP